MLVTKTIVLTGAARGIGLQLAHAYVERGDTVIATARDLSVAQGLSDLSACGSMELAQLDVTDAGSVGRFAERMNQRTIDVLINCAGVLGGDRQSLDDMTMMHGLMRFKSTHSDHSELQPHYYPASPYHLHRRLLRSPAKWVRFTARVAANMHIEARRRPRTRSCR
jgi:NAD(P)-dependent dehydrogenase (short-subunit alcohol dehydrogenase family)